MAKSIGIAVIISNPEQYMKVQDFLTRDVAWVDWHDNMYARETAIVLKANKNSDYSSGAVGCAEGMRNSRIKTVPFSENLTQYLL